MNPVVDLVELASRVAPGARLGLCADYGGVPMAALLEVIRQRRARDLHVICVPTGGLHVDMLIGAGVSGGRLEAVGMGPDEPIESNATASGFERCCR